jgi:SAM-dependent methyltransferase
MLDVRERPVARRVLTQALPVEDASVDYVVSVLTLCTIPAVDRALAEICRVLRPAGAFHFMEHGLSPEEAVARWLHRLTPFQCRFFGGCHLSRPIGRLVAGAGLDCEPAGPRPVLARSVSQTYRRSSGPSGLGPRSPAPLSCR